MDSSITWRVFIAEVPTKHSWSKRLNSSSRPFNPSVNNKRLMYKYSIGFPGDDKMRASYLRH
jgi:hypothetical protein